MADVCSGFESQNYLKDRCRKCFRQKDKHDAPAHTPVSKKERRRSWREKIVDNGGPDEDDGADQLSLSSYLSATSKGLSSVKSYESVNDTRSMVTAVSGSVSDDVRVMTPTEDDMHSDHEEYTPAVHCTTEKSDNKSEQTLVEMLEERLNEAENSIQDYRDENTVLKCELRDLQESTFANSDAKLREKISNTEALCDELMEENESLKAEVRELQREIEEMQDQYREEEIEEFRELQRELEQNAKNCRVLQFKLRKAERLKEQTDTEKLQLQNRLNDLLGSSTEESAPSTRSDGARVRELESELRIAKEVSVRLHEELEQAEEKRYKLEDEIFCMKEKVRELQTQNKWREARNKTDYAMKKLSAELSCTGITEYDASKELRDAIEREIDSREQLRFAEEDLKRTQERLKEVENENEILLKKLSKTAKLRPPMVRSASEGNAHLQLELAEHEVEHLSTKIERLKRTNDHLTRKILELETDVTRKPSECGDRHNCSEEELRKRMMILERELSEQKAAAALAELQNKRIIPEEIEQCCEVLASIESQTSRLCKQFEKIDNAQKDERRRSLSKDCSATIMAELANLLNELKSVHVIMDNIKESNPTFLQRSPQRELASSQSATCARCMENQKVIDEQQNEIVFYKKKNKDLTNQILQTEDRWTIEIEKQRQIFENEIKCLGCRLADSKRQVEEHTQMLQSKTLTLTEKTRALEEQEERCNRLQRELEQQKKEKQESEQHQKSVREFEIKYKKLESIFDQEREKMNAERTRRINEITALKKTAEDAEELSKKTSEELRKKESHWKTEKSSLEKEIASLRKQLSDYCTEEGKEFKDTASSRNSPAEETSSIVRHDSQKLHLIELKKQLFLYEKKCNESEAKLEEVKSSNADLLDQLTKTKLEWQKDKEAYQHKARQAEKIRIVEMDALQQKFSSRMRIMEDTNKSLHSQLVLARRERDTQKEALVSFERKLMEDRKENDLRDKEISDAREKIESMQKALSVVEAELERANTDLRITKEARKADQILWKIDRARGRNEKWSDEDLRAIEQLQTQFRDCERFYMKETERLNETLRTMSKELQKQRNSHDKIITELREQVRILEIEQKNLTQKKDTQVTASEKLEAGTARLEQVVHLNELQRLTRKYRLSSIIDQLQFVTDPIRRNGKSEIDGNPDGMRYIINQLIAIRDEDTETILLSDERCPSIQTERVGYAQSVSECENAYDNISQSSMSIRSVASMPAQTSAGMDNHYGRQGRLFLRRPNLHPADMVEARKIPDHSEESVNERMKEGSSYSEKPESLLAPRTFPRTSSFDGSTNSEQLSSKKSGTSILCRVRREELARGGHPSVRLMAKAFESIESCPAEKQGFFSMRKSRSVESAQDRIQAKDTSQSPYTLKHSSSQVKTVDEPAYATLPRGRNPFKNMGSKLVERVRRSLSRSSRHENECHEEKESKTEEPSTKPERCPTTLKKTKKRSAEGKARKI